jgi:3-hydroxyisobutyrate dehydrogenase
MNVGFVGIGHMGLPIAGHLLAAGHILTVHDIRRAATAPLIEQGAAWADSPAMVAAASQVVFTSLPGPADVDAVVMAKAGILEGASPGLVHIDISSNSPSAVRRLAGIEAARGVVFLDAPVSGGVRGAEEATLAVMVGGDAAAFEQVRPLLSTFGKNVFHIGEVGSGTLVKLMNNILSVGSGVLLQEVLAMGAKASLDPALLFEVWNVSSSSRQVQGIERLLDRNFDDPTFALALGAKDIGLCVEAARELGVPMTVGSAISQVFLRSVVRGLGDKSTQATLLTIEAEAGVRVPDFKRES